MSRSWPKRVSRCRKMATPECRRFFSLTACKLFHRPRPLTPPKPQEVRFRRGCDRAEGHRTVMIIDLVRRPDFSGKPLAYFDKRDTKQDEG